MQKKKKKTDFRSIYARVLSHCPPYHHEGLWQDVAAPDDVRRPPPDPLAVLADLRVHYPDPALLESGVATMSPDVEIQLAPALCAANTAVIALRRSPKESPFDLMTDLGCIGSGRLPLCSCLEDGAVQKMIDKKEPILCVTCSTADAAVLQSVGIPTTLATGLAVLKADHLKDLCKCYALGECSLRRPGIVEMPSRSPPAVVVVGWCPTSLTLEEPAGLADIITHLANTERYLQIHLEAFCTWTPAQSELEGIVYCKNHAGLPAVGAAIRKSIRSSARTLVPPWTEKELPEDLPDALKHLERLLSRSNRDGDAERKAWKHLRRVIENECIGPWFEQLEITEDAVHRNLLMMGASTSQISHAQASKILLRIFGDPKQKGAWRPNALEKEEFQQFMQTSGLLLKIVREIVQYQKNRNQY